MFGLSGGDEADGVVAHGVGDGQFRSVNEGDGEETILAVVLAAVVAIEAVWVVKRQYGVLEGQVMFDQICSGFFIVAPSSAP